MWGSVKSPGELELGPEPGRRQWGSKATAAGGPEEPRREGTEQAEPGGQASLGGSRLPSLEAQGPERRQ